VAPFIFSLGSRLKWADSFTLQSLYPRRKSPWWSHNGGGALLAPVSVRIFWRRDKSLALSSIVQPRNLVHTCQNVYRYVMKIPWKVGQDVVDTELNYGTSSE
jgi:hypothetical protein